MCQPENENSNATSKTFYPYVIITHYYSITYTITKYVLFHTNHGLLSQCNNSALSQYFKIYFLPDIQHIFRYIFANFQLNKSNIEYAVKIVLLQNEKCTTNNYLHTCISCLFLFFAFITAWTLPGVDFTKSLATGMIQMI